LEELNSFLSNAFHGLELVVMDQGKATRHLEEQIMRARMVPIDVLVDRLKRIIRQVSRELDKDVDFNVKAFGEADRKTLEKLTPALEHMVRNAIDHGIESPEVRKALGKPEKGQIKLVVYRQGNEIIIELSDDGQGIDVEKVLAKAVERDIWPKTQTMRKEDVLRIISLSGFSTRDEVTPISGRGVGMDVVMQEIQDLGGQLQVETKVNHGTRFTIRLPFSLALNQALIFTSGEQDYAILLTNITAISRLSQETLNIQFALEQHLIEYSGEAYQLVYLAELFQNKHWQNADKQQSYPVVFIHANENRVAFVIDKIIGSREVVIKPIGYQFETVKAFAGVSLLGDGRTVLVLNAPHLVQMTRQTTDSSMEGPVAHQKRITVLITDDSITVRQVTSRFLRRHQYIPMQAKDGLEALNAMAKSKPDVVLLDIEMPRMDGFEVIQKMRATPELHDIPIIVITSRALEKHRQRAMKLGANAYITKPFQENDLLELLQKLQPND
jgi:chemosensory pili system protein ChpA (sensor histidine kinase/response regulator)